MKGKPLIIRILEEGTNRRTVLTLAALTAAGCGKAMNVPRRDSIVTVEDALLSIVDEVTGRPVFSTLEYTDAWRPEGNGKILVLQGGTSHAMDPGRDTHLWIKVPGWKRAADPVLQKTPDPLKMRIRDLSVPLITATPITYRASENPLHADWERKRAA